MNILLTNDDGYFAAGILAVYHALEKNHNILLAAPDRERSAVGHAISLNQQLRVKPISLSGTGKGYAISGTPADCVKLALYDLCPAPPDLVISGINPGSNTGINIHYSGTAAAAREAALNGINGIAVSLEIKTQKHLDYNGMAGFISSIAEPLADSSLPKNTFLNINAPDRMICDISGVKITRQSMENLSKDFVKRTDPENTPYYRYGGVFRPQGETGTDLDALSRGYISISPILCDMTDHSALADLSYLTRTN